VAKVHFKAEFSSFYPLSQRDDIPENEDDSAILSNI
jgi:hypothetical protein